MAEFETEKVTTVSQDRPTHVIQTTRTVAAQPVQDRTSPKSICQKEGNF